MAKVTDLTSTTWRFGEYLKADYTTSFSYNVSFNIALNNVSITKQDYKALVLNYFSNGSRPYFLQGSFSWDYGDGNYGSSSGYVYESDNTVPRITANLRNGFEYLDMTFTGGTDATNADLIAWLEANATLVEEEPTATLITYNGETIATLEAGQTATIKTAETEVEHDIVITPVFPINIAYGDIIATAEAGQTATIKCANTEADFDIVVSAKPSVPTLSGAWVFNESVDVSIGFITQPITFTTTKYYGNVRDFISIGCDGTNIRYFYKTDTGSNFFSPYSGGSRWYISADYRNIDFGSTPQEVSEEFYNWFTANATKQ